MPIHFSISPSDFSVEDMDSYLQYVGGTTGIIALTGVAAATALYLATRPKPEQPLVPLHDQSPVLEVSCANFKYLLLT